MGRDAEQQIDHSRQIRKGGKRMTKTEVLKVIDEVMNNREIDSIRNAILAIRDKVKEFDELDYIDDCKIIVKDDVIRIEDPGLRRVMISLRHANELNNLNFCFEEARYVCIDTKEKIDTGLYGTMWYVKENWDEPL